MAPGGKSVITLRSTYSAKDPDTGERRLQSRILPVLPEGAVVTLTRSNTHFVATEYGAVCLRGLTVPQRAKALSPSPTRTFGIAGGGVSPHLPPVTARPYVETESGPGTDGFRGR